MTLHPLLAPMLCAVIGLGAPAALVASADSAPPVEAVQRAALRYAGLDPERLEEHLGRARWVEALPELRLRVIRDVDRDGRTTVRFSDARWLGDVAAVDTRGDGLRVQGELLWSPGALFGGASELAALKELRAAAAARRALLEAVTLAYFARKRALLAWVKAEDDAARRTARVAVDEHTALLDGLTGGAFSDGGAP